MTAAENYALGYRESEQQRLQRQAEELGAESAWLFDQIGIAEGARVLEIGCGPRGCLDLLSSRVGPTGRVVGVELSPTAVEWARDFLSTQGLQNVEVYAGDARAVGLVEGSFDVVTSRLVLVNIPEPEQVIATAVALTRPGGVVAFHEIDFVGVMCDPPSQAWSTLWDLYLTVSAKNGNDYYLGRRLPRMLRESGLVDVRVHPIMHHHPSGDPRRSLVVDFVGNFKDRIVAMDLATEAEVDELKAAVTTHLDDPGTAVFFGPYIQVWGRKPG
ncbi:SAM-dependent methyltransferase [Mycobacterium sp. OAS707]|uniref:methyltransferase domain-containing protein n=1 Tax=Mycobacterium sp. OAS707 TaxID=2663822 RepID=UPI00178A90A1|nr:methyltransferase domain-containing protein [Mycobacterium sp. OAS707]MBE1550766.1 SAM-dependent methyltransferase [Mycobacterium sp. OAS707]